MSRVFRSHIWNMPESDFRQLVKNSSSIGEILKAFGLENKGGNSNTIKRRIQFHGIDMSHIPLGKGSNKNRTFQRRRENHEIFIENCTMTRSKVKKRVLKDKLIPYVCSECGLPPVWNNKEIVLHLEHKNGISNDNRIENLTFLCPNCHSQTDTYAGKKKLAG